MKVRDIIKGASVILSKFDLASALDSEKIDDAFSSDVQVLVEATNLILNEIVSDYIPCYKVEEIEVKDYSYPISSLKERLLAIRYVKDKRFYSVKYKFDGDNLKLPNGKFNIKYTYLPDRVTIDSEIKGLDKQITDRVIIYGVVSEYYLINGLYNEAELMRSKFEGAITSACKRLSNIVMRGRVWE